MLRAIFNNISIDVVVVTFFNFWKPTYLEENHRSATSHGQTFKLRCSTYVCYFITNNSICRAFSIFNELRLDVNVRCVDTGGIGKVDDTKV